MGLILLNHTVSGITTQVIIEQNCKNTLLILTNKMNALEYVYLSSNMFFERVGSYINTEGNLKYTTELVSSI